MHRIIGVLLFVVFVESSFAQNINQSNIPAVVLNSFQVKFPNAEDVSWQQTAGNYHIKFESNKKFNEVFMDYRGNVIKYHQDLWGSEVPESVLNTIKSKVKYFDLNDADLIKEGKNIVYEINFKIEGKDHDFWIDEKGKLLKYREELKDSEIPSSMIKLINTQYGKVDIDRSKRVEENGKIIYIIRGEINDTDHIFTVDSKGSIIKHEQDLRDNEIPKAILQTLKTAYKDYDLRDADLLEEGGKTLYIMRIKRSKENLYLTFNTKGKILEER
ncbi:MAG: PepSY-like domain-containing protein [Prolixibacteraceae bacterium]